MSILKYDKKNIVAMVKDGLLNFDAIRHWDICKALSEGKKIESIAEDFKMHRRSIDWVKANKCNCKDA